MEVAQKQEQLCNRAKQLVGNVMCTTCPLWSASDWLTWSVGNDGASSSLPVQLQATLKLKLKHGKWGLAKACS